jgi:hypothetical protein
MSAAPTRSTSVPYLPPALPHPALSALLSFAIPGLGQIYQGLAGRNHTRLTKGCLFLVAIWGMFFYGFVRSHWRNVYLPHVQEQFLEEDRFAGRLNKSNHIFGQPLPPLLGNLWQRPQYVMQFFADLPAWPALWNYYLPDKPIFGSYQESPGSLKKNAQITRRQHWEAYEEEDNRIQTSEEMGRLWDIYWIYTVVAGALNLLVIYDAYAGPVRFKVADPKKTQERKK